MTDDAVPPADGEDALAPLAVVAGHGDFAQGLVSAVHQITGRGDAFLAVSNSGLSADDIASTISGALETHRLRVVFTDLPAGSCTMAVRRLQRTHPQVVLATGANVALLLEFLFALPSAEGEPHTGASVDVGALLRTAVDRARGTLTVQGG